ncbi:MAG: methyltransferase domain-containing protein [Pseudomonadota bacterium]
MGDAIDRAEGRRLFGADPAAYEAARPPYPDWIFEALVREGGLTTGSAVLEIGAGPGTATRQLLEHGAEPLWVVEPDTQFEAGLRRLLGGSGKVTELHVAPFETVSLPEQHFDLLVSATAFHWIAPALGLSKAHRLLKPGGAAALFWNVLQVLDRADEFHDRTASLLKDLAASPSGAPDTLPFALDQQARRREALAAGFEEVAYRESCWRYRLDTAGVVALYGGFSAIARLPEAERGRLLDALAAIADRDFGGVVERNVTSCLYLMR